MKKGNKLFSALMAIGILLSAGGSAYAAETGLVKSESPTIDWDKSWDNVDSGNFHDNVVDFGSSSDGADIGARAYGDLATGTTALSSASGKVTSTGTSKGKVISTTTSATTSLRMNGLGYIVGPKKVAVSKFTATSTVSTTNPSGTQSFEGLTVHSATNSGILYEAKTYDSKNY